MTSTHALLLLCLFVLLPVVGGCGEPTEPGGPDHGALTESALPDRGIDQVARPDAGQDLARGEARAADGPAPAPAPDAASPKPAHKGIWAWSATLRGHEAAVLSWVKQHKYTDLFVLVKGTSGTIKYDVLDKLLALRAAAPAGAPRIWAWLVGHSDASKASSSWTYLGSHFVSPDCPAYRSYLATAVRRAIDPSRGQVKLVPDGVMLDDSFQWPGPSYGGTTAHRVQSLMATVDALRAEVDATQKSTGKKILLGFAPHPETAVYSKGSTILSYSAYAYGQDFGELARRCDWIVPETYRYGFYGQTSAWIGKVVQAIRNEIALECPARSALVTIYPAIVLYTSDTSPTAASATEVAADRSAALAAAGGYSVFRYASKNVNPGTKTDGHDWPTAAQSQVLDP